MVNAHRRREGHDSLDSLRSRHTESSRSKRASANPAGSPSTGASGQGLGLGSGLGKDGGKNARAVVLTVTVAEAVPPLASISEFGVTLQVPWETE